MARALIGQLADAEHFRRKRRAHGVGRPSCPRRSGCSSRAARNSTAPRSRRPRPAPVQDRQSRFRPRPSRPWWCWTLRLLSYGTHGASRSAATPVHPEGRRAPCEPRARQHVILRRLTHLTRRSAERKYERIDLLRPVRAANWRRRWETSSPLRVSRGSSGISAFATEELEIAVSTHARTGRFRRSSSKIFSGVPVGMTKGRVTPDLV